MNFVDIITPTWPSGIDEWEGIVVLTLLGLFKIDRGTMMYRRAPFVDRLGWSIIVFDLLFGLISIMTVLSAFYPPLELHKWFPRASILLLLASIIWQWWEIRHAPEPRIEQAVSGIASGGVVPSGNGDRRSDYRRREDKDPAELRMRAERYEERGS